MRAAFVITVLISVVAARANAQAVSFPADADMRAMQAPADWNGSRAQHVQGDDTPVAPPVAPTPGAPLPQNPAHPDYIVQVWDDRGHLVETMARYSDLPIGTAAFKVAAKERQGLKVTLSQGVTVIDTKEAGRVASR